MAVFTIKLWENINFRVLRWLFTPSFLVISYHDLSQRHSFFRLSLGQWFWADWCRDYIAKSHLFSNRFFRSGWERPKFNVIYFSHERRLVPMNFYRKLELRLEVWLFVKWTLKIIGKTLLRLRIPRGSGWEVWLKLS